MAMEFITGPMAGNMKACGKMANSMEKESIHQQMGNQDEVFGRKAND